MAQTKCKYDRSRDARKERLKAEGRWQQYLKRRKEVQEERHTPSLRAAEYYMEDEFAPLEPDAANLPLKKGDCPRGMFPNGEEDPRIALTEGAERPALEWDGKDCSVRKSYRWALKHLGIEDADTKCDPPSAMAADLWRTYRKNEAKRETFYELVGTKFIGNAADADDEERHSDDGREPIVAIERLRIIRGQAAESLLSDLGAGAESVGRELGVAGADDPPGGP